MKRHASIPVTTTATLLMGLWVLSPVQAEAARGTDLTDAGVAAVATDRALPDDAREHIEKGDQKASEGRYAAARREYRKAVEIALEDGRLPVLELRRVANSYYYQGRLKSAAATLERLADEAAETGELTVEAWAVADAAWMFAKAATAELAGQRARWNDWTAGQEHVSPLRPRATLDMDRLIRRLELLLDSEYLPDDVREKVEEKRLGDLMRLASR